MTTCWMLVTRSADRRRSRLISTLLGPAAGLPYTIGMRLSRRAAGLVGWAALAAVAGGCKHGSSTDLTITVTAFEETSYQLRCDPPGGDLPRAAAVCEELAQHRDLFLSPPPTRSTCAGSVGVPPSISIEGLYRDDEVRVAGRSCDWPGGLGLAVIEAALSLRPFEQAVARLRCGEDPRLLVPTTPWRSVQACLRDPRKWGR